jgi:predicted RNase H-like nuclease
VFTRFEPPRLASFAQALAFIDFVDGDGPTLVAIDQPTIVPNASGMRLIDRTAASIVSWLGGGVQPANRGKKGMFDDAAPIWPFLTALNATEDPEGARSATEGRFYFEVFLALALASIDDGFFGRLAGPRYNPARKKTFRLEHWHRVLRAVAADARRVGCGPLAEWCDQVGAEERPTKADQDRLDAAICLLVAIAGG